MQHIRLMSAAAVSLALSCTGEVPDGMVDDESEDAPYDWLEHCGDGVCSPELAEYGAYCPQDCCDLSTPCDRTYLDLGEQYCREMWPDNPSEVIGWHYQWLTRAEIDSYCDEPAEQCRSRGFCATQWAYSGDLAKQAICSDPTGTGSRWTAWTIGTAAPECAPP